MNRAERLNKRDEILNKEYNRLSSLKYKNTKLRLHNHDIIINKLVEFMNYNLSEARINDLISRQTNYKN